jgi:LPS export ABC transporter protein LptC
MIKMSKIRKMLAAAIFLSIAVLAGILWLKLPEMRKKGPALSRLPRNIDISLKTVRYAENRDGVKKWELEAQQADVEQKSNLIHLTAPRFVVFLEPPAGTVTLTAGRADYDIKTRDVTLNDEVTGVGTNGMNVRTEHLFYDAGRSLLHTDGHITLVHRTMQVEGDGMELNTALGTVRLKRNVSARLSPVGR